MAFLALDGSARLLPGIGIDRWVRSLHPAFIDQPHKHEMGDTDDLDRSRS